MTLIYKLLPEIFGALLLAAIFYIGYLKGQSGCEISHAKAETHAIQKVEKDRAKIKKKVMDMSDSDLDAAISKWVR